MNNNNDEPAVQAASVFFFENDAQKRKRRRRSERPASASRRARDIPLCGFRLAVAARRLRATDKKPAAAARKKEGEMLRLTMIGVAIRRLQRVLLPSAALLQCWCNREATAHDAMALGSRICTYTIGVVAEARIEWRHAPLVARVSRLMRVGIDDEAMIACLEDRVSRCCTLFWIFCRSDEESDLLFPGVIMR